MKRAVWGLLGVGVMLSCADYDLLDQKPGTVQLYVTEVQDSSVTVHWTQSEDEDFKSYKLYYDTCDNLSRLADSTLFAQDTGKTIKGLTPATTYYFAVFMTNQAGKSSMSNVATAVTWLQFYPQTWSGDSAVVLKWQRPRGVSATVYRVFGDTAQSVDTLDTLLAQVSTNDTSCLLARLKYGTTENIRVFAWSGTSSLTGSVTTQVQGWWFSQHDPAQLDDSSFTLSWDRVSGSVQEYRAFRSTVSPADTNDTQCGVFSASDSSGIVTGLSAGTRYYFKVYARSSSGYIAWTQETTDSL